MSKLYDDGGTITIIPDTEISGNPVDTYSNSFSINTGDAWIGKAIGVGLYTAGSYPELDNITLIQTNAAPEFNDDPIVGTVATEAMDYNGTITGQATDPDGDEVTYSKVFGSNWLHVDSDGTLSGVPDDENVGLESFTVQAIDGNGRQTQATLQISVLNTYSGELGLADFAGFAVHWLETDCGYCSGADLTGDGHVTLDDLRHLAENWLTSP